MDDDSEEEDKDQTLTNFWYGNVDEKGRLDGAEYLPEVRGAFACSAAISFSPITVWYLLSPRYPDRVFFYRRTPGITSKP